jgi:transposase-like protein
MSFSKKKNQYYSETFRREVVKLVESGQMSVLGASRHFGINGSMTVYRWLEKYQDPEATPPSNESPLMSAPSQASAQSEETLRAEVESLKRLLEHERLRSEAYHEMIKLAESKFKIPIEKKSGPKQSK